MGTGIVSIGLALDGQPLLSWILLGIAIVLWFGLGAVFAGRALFRRERWLDDARSPAALTAVAGTAVLGDRITLLGADWAGEALLAAAGCLWLLLLIPVLGRWRTPTLGVSFLLTVATESLAVLAALLAIEQRLAWLALASLVPFVLGLLAYGFVWRRLERRHLVTGRGDHWVSGGALAIATLACARATAALRVTSRLPSLQHPLEHATLVLWAAAVLWIPALVIGELIAPRPGYESRRWSTVFPLGMYGVCSIATGNVTGIGGLDSFGRIWIWLASAVWLIVLAGMLRRACGSRPGKMG